MPALIESPPRTLSFADLAGISQTLAEQVGRFPLRREGFSVADYLSLGGGVLVEYVDGSFQVLPMPNVLHQALVTELHNRLFAWSTPDLLARTTFAPFPVYLTQTVYREPDVCLMLGRNAARRHLDHWEGADLVVEIISGSNRDHDVTTKRADYAAAGIPEYWIVDPDPRTVRVLNLPPGATGYAVHGEFGPGQVATSVLLDGFAVDVSDLFAAAERRA